MLKFGAKKYIKEILEIYYQKTNKKIDKEMIDNLKYLITIQEYFTND